MKSPLTMFIKWFGRYPIDMTQTFALVCMTVNNNKPNQPFR